MNRIKPARARLDDQDEAGVGGVRVDQDAQHHHLVHRQAGHQQLRARPHPLQTGMLLTGDGGDGELNPAWWRKTSASSAAARPRTPPVMHDGAGVHLQRTHDLS